jgi:hypothetical protein
MHTDARRPCAYSRSNVFAHLVTYRVPGRKPVISPENRGSSESNLFGEGVRVYRAGDANPNRRRQSPPPSAGPLARLPTSRPALTPTSAGALDHAPADVSAHPVDARASLDTRPRTRPDVRSTPRVLTPAATPARGRLCALPRGRACNQARVYEHDRERNRGRPPPPGLPQSESTRASA